MNKTNIYPCHVILIRWRASSLGRVSHRIPTYDEKRPSLLGISNLTITTPENEQIFPENSNSWFKWFVSFWRGMKYLLGRVHSPGEQWGVQVLEPKKRLFWIRQDIQKEKIYTYIPSSKLTWQQKVDLLKMYLLFYLLGDFSCHVSSPKGTSNFE